MGEFGNKFRKEREAKKFSLDDVSNVTKISARMLKAIEEEHFEQLPGGVFNRGFIRAYSKHLGLNEEEAVNDYLACLRQAQVDAREVLDPRPPSQSSASNKLRVVESRQANKPAEKSSTPVQVDELPELQLPRAEHVRPSRRAGLSEPREFPFALTAIVLVFLALGIFLWMRHSRAKDAVSPAPAASNQLPAAPATSPVPATQSPAAASHSPAPVAKPSVPQTAPRSSALSTPTPAAEMAHTKVATEPSQSSTSTAAVAKSLTLVIRATETSWVSISADGQQVAQETLIAPAHTTVRANSEITVRVGNAAGVNFVFNGKELPAQGAESEAQSFVFDAQGMRAPASDQTPR